MSNNTEDYDLTVYSVDAIRTAISYYMSICRIDCHLEGKQARCYFDIEDRHVDRVIKEFGNFLIELMQHENENTDVDS